MTNAKKYYAVDNFYGSAVSQGFSNTNYVYAFNSKKTRDAWVAESDRISRLSIRRDEAINLASNDVPGPAKFSSEFWAIVDNYEDDLNIPGLVGELQIYSGNGHVVDRFYKAA